MTKTPGNKLVTVFENVSVKSSKTVPDSKNVIHHIGLYMSWRAILAEFISTLFLIFLGCMSCVPFGGAHSPLYAPITFGLVVLFNIQAFGHISSAHMNPAVTFGAVLWGKMSVALGIAYVIAQCMGSIVGYWMLMAISPIDLIANGVCNTQPHPQHTMLQAVAVEVILTAALIFLNCAVWDPYNAKTLESVSIKFGFTVTGLSLAGSPFTGASMNPARSLGPMLWTGTWGTHWVYWLGPLIGALLSALLYKYVWLDNNHSEQELNKV